MFGFYKSISNQEVEYSIRRASLFINGASELDKSLNIYNGFELSSHFLNTFKQDISTLTKAQNLHQFTSLHEEIRVKLEHIKKKIEDREKSVIDTLMREISKIETDGLQRTYTRDDFGNTALLSPFYDLGNQLRKIIEIKKLIGSNVNDSTFQILAKINDIEAL